MEQTARIVGLTLALFGFAVAADAAEPFRLTGSQLDAVNAGKVDLGATGSGSGEAHGAEAGTTVTIATAAGLPGPNNAVAFGQVMSTASSPGAVATASSVLFLSITTP